MCERVLKHAIIELLWKAVCVKQYILPVVQRSTCLINAAIHVALEVKCCLQILL